MKSDSKYIWVRNIALVILASNLMYHIFPFPPSILRAILIGLCTLVIFWDRNNLDGLSKWMLAICAMNLIYFVIAAVARRPSPNSLANNLCAFLPVCLFAFLSRKGVITPGFMRVMTIVLLLCSIGYYIHYESIKYTQMISGAEDSVTINASTVFLCLLPLLFYEKNRPLLYAEIVICVFFIVSAVKRGNIVAAVVPVIFLLINQFKLSKKNAFYLLLLLIVISVGTYFLLEYINSNAYFLRRLNDTMEGNTSNRDRIYRQSFSLWWNSNIFNFIFGHGYRALTRINHIPAHSDWLELLGDNGLIGLSLYLGVFIALAKVIFKTPPGVDRMVLLSAAAIWFAKSLYSMAYVENFFSLLMISIGFVLGKHNTDLISSNEQNKIVGDEGGAGRLETSSSTSI